MYSLYILDSWDFLGHCPLTKLSYPSPIYVVKNLEFLYKNLHYQHFLKIMDQRLIWFFFPYRY